MSAKKNASLVAPAIAVVLIVLGAVLADYFLVPERPVTQQPDAEPATTAPVGQPPIEAGPPASAVSQEVPVATLWSTYHGGPDLSGYTDAAFPDKPGVLWQYLAEGATQQPPVGDEQGIYLSTITGTVIALDFQGKERWKVQLVRKATASGRDEKDRVQAPVSCFRGRLFVGSTSGILRALDVATGAEQWAYDVNGEILGSAVLSAPDGDTGPVRVVVIERGNGALHAVDLATGQRAWRTEDVARCDGSPAVADGFVVYGSCATAFHIHAVSDGKRIRNIDLCSDCQVASGPAFVGGDLYCGARSGYFYRADSRNGRIVWLNRDSQGDIFTSPAITKDLVVFGSEDGGVYAVNRENGDKKWRFDTGKLPSSPLVAGDKVILGADGVLQVLKLATGEPLWNYEVSDGIAAPSFIHGMVVVCSEDGTVMAFGNKS